MERTATAMRIVFIGLPGVGKGTQAQRVTEYLKIPHLSTGDMLRSAMEEGTKVGKLAADFINAGRLVPDPVVVDVVAERLAHPDCAGGCLFDGFPRTKSQALALDEYLKGQDDKLDAAFFLNAPQEEVIQRLQKRGRGDDNRETILERCRHYEEQTAPLVEYFQEQGIARSIDGVGTEEEVFLRIKAEIDKIGV